MKLVREPISRRTMTLFFVVDTSGSMRGEKIKAVNEGIRKIIPIIGKISDNNPDARINVASLQFSTDVSWAHPEPLPAEQFEWCDLHAGGKTSLGAACEELSLKMSRSGLFGGDARHYAPVVILLSDGGPTDSWKEKLENLKKNSWFSHAIKIAIAIGDKSHHDVLESFTGSKESVIDIQNVDLLERLIRIVVVSSISIASQSHSVSGPGKQQQMETEVARQMEDSLKCDEDYSEW